jgi:proline dehydrogenase
MRYVAGDNEGDALGLVHELNQLDFSAALDILGEHSKSVEKAKVITESYIRLFEVIADSSLDCNISIKLTHLGLGYDDKLAEDNLFALLETAEEIGNFLRIDMENTPFTDTTLSLYEKCKSKYAGVGPVLQAYLRRSETDLKRLICNNLNVRICKGIYLEPEELAFHDREEIRESYIKLVQTGLSEGAYIGIATHDIYLIDTWRHGSKIKPSRRNATNFKSSMVYPWETGWNNYWRMGTRYVTISPSETSGTLMP